MAYGTTHPAETHHADTGIHVVTWILGVLGVVAAAIGTWIALAPSDGTITLFDQTWKAAEIEDFWAPMLLIAGGAVAAVAMVTAAMRDVQHKANPWLIAVEIAMTAIGVAAAVFGIVVAI